MQTLTQTSFLSYISLRLANYIMQTKLTKGHAVFKNEMAKNSEAGGIFSRAPASICSTKIFSDFIIHILFIFYISQYVVIFIQVIFF